MTVERSTAAYRTLLRLYPRRFREEYADDMALAFSDLLADESPARVWRRTASDLVRTVPARHLEARMDSHRPSIAPIVLGAVAVAGMILGVVAIGAPAVATFAFAIAGLAALAAVALQRRDARPLATVPAWTLAAVGAIGLGTVVLYANIVEEVGDGLWAPLMIVSLASVLLLAVGVALGIADRLVARRS